ncbi:hypothetical protein PSTG_10757 [Puccinia striiformis f. sp. tritici PST-78]|uniref:CCHC-type domain-containing protein n=1 Tax=Puccinia striiformis f. sp. tritici PST-78 TaxID=1165861 RepID=A0A0L0V9K7_9BASI|nr:hypothetical protein PSTG_10757 [Puccinia striiformis f. sp. tritici PST-78]
MSSHRQIQNVAGALPTVEMLNGKSEVFPRWCCRLDDVLSMQGTMDIVNGTIVRPPKTEPKADLGTPPLNDYKKGYNPKDNQADWDSLSELACATIRLTLSVPLAQRYRTTKPASRLCSTIIKAYEKNTRARRIQLQDAFWSVKHDPTQPIALWIGQIRVAADTLLTAKQLPTDQQITDRLIGGLHKSWSSVKDSIVFATDELSLDDAIGALEAHEININNAEDQSGDIISAAVASSKRFGCSNCGKIGHRSSECRKPKTSTYQKTKAGAAVAVKLGDFDSDSYDEDDNNNEIDVIYE